MMGSGKSTVGARVAALLKRPFIDVDTVLEQRTGQRVADQVEADEPGFRRREAEILADLAGGGSVIATGGGAVLVDTSVAVMRGSGVVVWLDAPVAVLLSRVADGVGRPLLGSEPERDLTNILRQRRALYEQAAHAVVDAARPVDEVAAAVIEATA